MSIRKMTSLTALLSFVLLFITIFVLYIVPQGRVAYWADWRLWGLTKTQWGNIHINTGLLFLLSIFLHIYYNWKSLLLYLKNKARRLRVLTREFNAALLLTIIFALGTYLEFAPFSWILDLNTYFKDRGAAKYGEPPYGHAELSSLKTFASNTGLDLSASLQRLKQADIFFENQNQQIKDIARLNNISPQQVYQAMKPTDNADQPSKLPPAPPPGTGNKTLTELCGEYGLDIQRILNGLLQEKISAAANMTIRAIAQQNNMAPSDIYNHVIRIAKNKEP
jgi:hypothetical protein